MRLVVWYHHQQVAHLDRGDEGVRLTYTEDWLSQATAFPLSASLPLSDQPGQDAKAERWLWNLLPEDPTFLTHLARQHGVRDTSDVMALLKGLGEDLPGALATLPEGRQPDERVVLEELSDTDIAAELTRLRSYAPGSSRRLSLAGAQPKTALYQSATGAWMRPSYAAASTHILKPPMPGNDDLELVETLMQTAAAGVGIDAAASRFATFDGVPAFISTRFDRRLRGDGTVERLHTEDLLQALGRDRRRKYQRENGPGLRELMGAVRRLCPDREEETWRRVAFNVLSGNADAHAKNWSFTVGPDGHDLAPAYDLVSLAPYPQYDQELAMSVGRQWRYDRVTDEDWAWAARKTKADPAMVARAVEQVSDLYPSALAHALDQADADTPVTSALASRTLVRVSAYTRADGTQVRAHWRAARS